MQREVGFVVVVALVVVALVVLAVHLMRLRARLRHLERFVDVLVGIGDLEAKRAAARRAEDLERLAAVELAQAQSATGPADDEACTKVWTGRPAALVEAAARGANPSSQATPRAAVPVDVAPRAVASPPPLPRAAQLAAGLERPKSTRSPPHAPPARVRTGTLAGMASPLPLAAPEGDTAEERPSWPSLKQHGGAASTRPPPGVAPVVSAPRFAPTLLSMQAQPAPPHEAPTRRDAVAVGTWTSPKPGDDDGETTSARAFDPPRYGPRSMALRPPPLFALLADPSLMGSEERDDEDARPSLGTDEPTPPRGVPMAPLLPVVQGPDEGKTCGRPMPQQLQEAVVQLGLEHAEMRASFALEVLSSRPPRAKDPT